MKTASYDDALLLEPIGGISGDLFLGAMADLGVELGPLCELLGDFGLDGFTLDVEAASESAISGSRVTVRLEADDDTRQDAGLDDETQLDARLDDTLDDRPDGGPGSHGHRPWAEIRQFLQRLPTPIGTRALAIFGGLANAEAAIHGTSVDEVEFHEVGAVDSIVDIVGAAWALEQLGVHRVFTHPPPLGSGVVRSQHGLIPIPAPATLALLRGKPVRLEGQGELTTPTGAAILAACASFELPAQFVPKQVGYGVGHRRFPDRPNLLRATLGKVAESRGASRVLVVEAHLDDASPQVLAYLVERLLEAGALDAGLSPLVMKKGRPGHRLTIVCRSSERQALTSLVFRESTTLGVRVSEVEREELEREIVTAQTAFGAIRVKLARLGGEVVNATPEYDDCAAAARRTDRPLKEVQAAALSKIISPIDK